VNALRGKTFLLSAVAILAWAAKVPIAKSQATNLEGRQLLASHCGSCHGIDGKGSERAPNIADSPHTRQLSDAQLEHIIAGGIPGTGMPAFHSLSNSRIHQLISYLRSLEGTEKSAKLPGDPRKGQAIFFDQGGCSNCHMIAGRGGFIASDLIDYARTHSREQIRGAILDSGAGDKRQVRLATATVRTGEKFIGRVRNEDNFSLQLQSLDGTFHFIMKSELEKLDYDPQPLMPTNFGSSLTASELNDLISYLLSAAGNTDPEKRAHEKGMDDLEN
jgi:cytochrome c oxidase cbb3-type subunit III